MGCPRCKCLVRVDLLCEPPSDELDEATSTEDAQDVDRESTACTCWVSSGGFLVLLGGHMWGGGGHSSRCEFLFLGLHWKFP